MNTNDSTILTDVEFLNDTIQGLSGDRKSLSCKYFYDERGSKLFEKICELDEYYLTRVEAGIMEQHAKSIASQIDSDVMLVEYGSGSSVKTRLLLETLISPTAYVPVDISEEHLLRTADNLRAAYPEIEILPVVADFTKPFQLPESTSAASHVALYFPGSTIGNFSEQDAGDLLALMSSMLGQQGGLLIGIDLQKEPAIVEAAYNDSAGVTAEFNLNILNRINVELDGNFDLANFHHRSVYNESMSRIETSIVSSCDQQVAVAGQLFEFARGEEIHTEYSYKYTIEGFAEFANPFGFRLHEHWTDEDGYFAVLHLVRE
jgi:dimethylhistidine N-methyltransferase